MEELLHKIIEGWYIYDNALFEVSLTHELKENSRMSCPFRCGKGLIEFNPTILAKYSKDQIEELLKIECVRIILKHPYERQPVECSPKARSIGSDIIIADNYDLKSVSLKGSHEYGLDKDNCFEWYAHNIEEMLSEQQANNNAQSSSGSKDSGESPEDSSQREADSDKSNTDKDSSANQTDEQELSDDESKVTESESKPDSADEIGNEGDSQSDKSALWEEESFMENYLNTIIEKIEGSKNWGSIPGNMVEAIVANARAKIDYRKVLSGFRASILSSKRNLTRMRPNRRTGFDNMGSIRRLNTRLLVAVDVSGSVSSVSLSLFLTVVNKAFKYGIEELDLITFDTEIHDKIQFKKAKKNIKITGRGGTNFQPAIDYAVSEKYDGVIFFTDGYAPVPTVPPFKGLKVAWVIDTPDNYKACQESLSKVGRCCVIDN